MWTRQGKLCKWIIVLQVQSAGDWKNRWSVRSLLDNANRSVEGSMPEAQSRV